MIISRTPYRISLIGGGTDLPSFYKYNSPGQVISTTINKYITIIINPRFDDKIRISYSKTENVSRVKDIKHELVREALKEADITKGIEIVSIGDIPSGSGLGSSGAFTVGLVNTLYRYKCLTLNASQIAKKATEIEMKHKPIGLQDQYASAYGGLNHFKFIDNNKVDVNKLKISKTVINDLQSRLLLFSTNLYRLSDKILSEQQKQLRNEAKKQEKTLKILELVSTLKEELENGNVDATGEILHESWMLKRQLTNGISNSIIDNFYSTAIDAGAKGGKIVGAGGGGFLMLYVPEDKQMTVCNALRLKRLEFQFEEQGSHIIFLT